ncbi:aminotransferase class V-fold PLP-dependent enzyme [Clostridium sp. LP20]|uniref:aminotransferase class V-fold PLP-dependent enzyme n=1 Tax=Clostridium sp. LP20 TaxID=3418665 RepID=UPI003EE6D451
MVKKDILQDFPILQDDKLVYLDSAATTQKPKAVLEAIEGYYKEQNANPHRGAYNLSILSTDAYDKARVKIQKFIDAEDSREVIFTKNATEGFNLIAESYGMDNINEGDEIVISILEHHSNLIPWQRVARVKNAKLKYLYIDENGEISKEEIESKITDKTKIVSITQVSNALGTINPVKEIAAYAHSKGAVVIVDGAQSVPHMKVSVRDLDADFLVFSGHKLLGPMGIGVVYGKKNLLENMSPYILGGDMIEYVYEDSATYAEIPCKFEAGTQNVEAAVGLGLAIDYLNEIGLENIKELEESLISYGVEKLSELDYVTVYGPKDIRKRSGVISFAIDGIHPHDVASLLDSYGIAIRSGNHCAQPLMRYMNINSTCRASVYLYNTREDIDKLVNGVERIYNKFKEWRK